MSKAQLQLEDYWVGELVLRSGRGQESVKSARGEDRQVDAGSVPDPRVDWETYESEKDHAYLIHMTIRVGRKRGGISGTIEIFGVFTTSPGIDDAALARLLELNAPPILFGIARGVFGCVSGVAWDGKYVLPSVNFLELTQRRARRIAKTSLARKRGAG